MQGNLRTRQFFTFNEEIQEEENECLEFKHFKLYPFKKEQLETIQKLICALVNHKGGRIFIGITDERIVKGVTLSQKNKDTFVNGVFHSLISNFVPSLTSPEKLYEVHFLPVQGPNGTNLLEVKCVIKIIVKQGLTKKLYSTNNDCLVSYKRVDARVIQLNVEEICQEIIKREKNLQTPLPSHCFDDPVPLTAQAYQNVIEISGRPVLKPRKPKTYGEKEKFNPEIFRVIIGNLSEFGFEEEFRALIYLLNKKLHSVLSFELFQYPSRDPFILIELLDSTEAKFILAFFEELEPTNKEGGSITATLVR